jgi:hypothetical protein
MARTIFLPLASIFLQLPSLGCGTQADTGYRGESLATISGAIRTGAVHDLPPSVDAAIVWAQVEFVENAQLVQSVQWVGASTPVTGQFPAQFTLTVYQPPPASVMIPCPSSPAHLAVGFVVAVDGSADIGHGDPRSAVIGEANDDLLLYLDSDQAADWSCVPDLGFRFTPSKGYHLLTQVPDSLQPRAAGAVYPAYVEASNGLMTPISVTLGGSELGPDVIPPREVCVSSCESKAGSCGAPRDAATAGCASVCAAAPTERQLSCLQASSCTYLKGAYKNGQAFCGISIAPPK